MTALTNDVDPVSRILAWMRDGGILATLVYFGWKARDVFQNVADFTGDIKEYLRESRLHMVSVNSFMQKMATNHIYHMERYLYAIAKDRNKTAVLDPGLIAMENIDSEPLPVPDRPRIA